jgi:hypothetical protein
MLPILAQIQKRLALGPGFGHFARLPTSCGAIAQLGERNNGIVEVTGSIPVGSTIYLSKEI